MISAISWITAWLVFIILMVGISKTDIGGKIVYYIAWLGVLLLLVLHYKELTALIPTSAFTQGQQ